MSHSFVRTSMSVFLGLVITFAGVSPAQAAGGSLDLTFGNGGIVTSDIGGLAIIAEDVAVQADGKILVAGVSSDGPEPDFALARFNSDGSLDTAFGSGGRVTTVMGERDEIGSALVLQADGRIIVAGSAHNGRDSDIVLARYSPDGSLDASFGVGGKVINPDGSSSHYATDAVLQPDGKIVVTGYAYDEFGNQDILLYRYEENGSSDTSFGSNGIVVLQLGCSAAGHAAALQPDGKILVAGKHCGSIFYEFDFALARFNVDGSLDVTFDGDGILTTGFGDGSLDEAYGIVIQTDGRIVLAGQSYPDSDSIVFAMARYNSDGSPDTSFDGDGQVTTDLSGGSEVGSAIVLQLDGRIIVAGEKATLDGTDFLMMRYNIDGSLDTFFGINGQVTTDIRVTDYGVSMALQADGKILLAGTGTNNYDNDFDFILARYESDTPFMELTLDVRPGKFPNRIEIEKNVCKDNDNLPVAILTTPEFDALRLVDATSLQLGDPVLGGTAAPIHSQGRDIDRDGDRDVWLLFAMCDLVSNSALNENSTELVLSGSTLEGGTFTARDSVEIIGHKPPASIVPVFDYPVDGQALDFEGSYLFRVQPIPSAEGYLWGFFQNGIMVWENYRDEGTLSGNEYGIHPGTLAHSKFVPGPVEVWVRASIKGQWTDAAVITIYLQSVGGPLDPTFGDGGRAITDFGNGSDSGSAVILQPDGKILVAGTAFNGINEDMALARYNSDGSLDMAFDIDGTVTTDFDNNVDIGGQIALQPDGKILVAGFSDNGVHTDFALVRYNPDGSLDVSFGTGGKVITDFGNSDELLGAVLLRSGGEIILAGSTHNGSQWDFVLVGYNPDGSLDMNFGITGKVTTDFSNSNDFGTAAILSSDGQIVMAGSTRTEGALSDFALARYNADGSLDSSFGSDGKVITDFANSDDYGSDLVMQPDGKIVAAGVTYHDIRGDFALARYNSDGSLDMTFDSDGKVTTDLGNSSEFLSATILQPDGKILVAGSSHSNSNNDFALARYNSDGSLDLGFDNDGIVTTDFGGDDFGSALTSQPDAKIIVAGSSGGDFALARYDAAGSNQAVNIDIKPGSQTNRLNPESRERIHVAILSTPEFDALLGIDRTSLRFGRTGAEESLHSCREKGRDVNHDGLRDLICIFSIQAAGFQPGDTTGILTAQSVDGFPVTGQDSVRVGRDIDSVSTE